MISYENYKTTSKMHTDKNFGVGVNAVTITKLVTAFSFSEKKHFKTNPLFKLPSNLFRFVLFLTAATRVTAVLFKNTYKLINVILEIAPRGISFLLSLINIVFLQISLSRAKWPMKSNDEEDNSLFCSNDLPLFPLYVQYDLDLYE